MPSGRRLFLLALVVSLCVTGAIAIGTLLFAEFDDTAGRILATTALLAVASLFALPAGVLLDQGRAGGLAWTVISASAAGFVVAMVVLWAYDVEWLWKLGATLGLAAGAGAQASATTSRVREGDNLRVRALYWIGIGLSAVFAALTVIAGWAELEDAAGYYRVVGATAVAAVLATLLQPILRRMEAPADARFELRITLDSAPSEEAVAAAVEALERHGPRVEKVVGPRV
jgi:hypothetical protein